MDRPLQPLTACFSSRPPPPLQKETLPSTRLATLPQAFGTRVLPAQATEYKFAFIQVPQDVSPGQAYREGRGCPVAPPHLGWQLSSREKD